MHPKPSDVHPKLSDVHPKPSDEQQISIDEDLVTAFARLFNLLNEVHIYIHPSNQAKKLLNNRKLPKKLAVSFLFLTFAPTFASRPTRLGF